MSVGLGFGQIVTFDFDGNVGNEASVASNYNDANLGVSTITRGGGLTFTSTNADRFNARSWSLDDIATAFSEDSYMEFTITPSVTYRFDVSSIVFNFQRSGRGPRGISLRSSLDGFSTDIDGEKAINDNANTQVISFDVNQSNNFFAVTYRVYGWAEMTIGSGGFEGVGNDIVVNGTVSSIAPCLSVSIWDGTTWFPSAPTSSSVVVINGSYAATSANSFSACSLIVNDDITIDNGGFIEVENDVVIYSGNFNVETQGAFVQRGVGAAAGSFNVIGGTANVNKTTRTYSYNVGDLHYVYWGSPVKTADIVSTFPNPNRGRRYFFSGQDFLDEKINATGAFGQDDIDDDDNDWHTATGIMKPGHGYVVPNEDPILPPGPGPVNYSDITTFTGEFNTGDISVPVYRNDDELNDVNWNLLGNPYPSAISTDAFFSENGYSLGQPNKPLEVIIYLWTHNSQASSSNAGNQAYNYSLDDYAYVNLSGGTAAISGGDIPNKFIPSGQGFFVQMHNDATPISGVFPNYSSSVKFTNSMRMADGISNSQFFKNSQTKNKSGVTENKIWINLTSDNGVFSQVLIAYLNGATNEDDGLSYDASRITTPNSTILYSIISDSDKKFVIQGKNENSINSNETINIGFSTKIDVPTLYTLSIADFQGDFLTTNTIYLKDNLLNKLHKLTDSDYTFTSEVGEFNSRFDIVFNANALSVNNIDKDVNALKIVELQDDQVQFSTSNSLSIKSVRIYDLLGRQLYNLSGSRSVEVYNLSNLGNTVYIAKVQLSNGTIITKKAIKR